MCFIFFLFRNDTSRKGVSRSSDQEDTDPRDAWPTGEARAATWPQLAANQWSIGASWAIWIAQTCQESSESREVHCIHAQHWRIAVSKRPNLARDTQGQHDGRSTSDHSGNCSGEHQFSQSRVYRRSVLRTASSLCGVPKLADHRHHQVVQRAGFKQVIYTRWKQLGNASEQPERCDPSPWLQSKTIYSKTADGVVPQRLVSAVQGDVHMLEWAHFDNQRLAWVPQCNHGDHRLFQNLWWANFSNCVQGEASCNWFRLRGHDSIVPEVSVLEP